MLRAVIELDRRIARLAIPALGSIAAEPLYNLADTAIVGHLGRSPLDALAIAATALSMMAWLAIFLSTATTTEVARNAARGAHAAAARAVGAAYAVAAGWGAVTLVVVVALAPYAAWLLGARRSTSARRSVPATGRRPGWPLAAPSRSAWPRAPGSPG
jgi:Na+-driven multidrug efflux pump